MEDTVDEVDCVEDNLLVAVNEAVDDSEGSVENDATEDAVAYNVCIADTEFEFVTVSLVVAVIVGLHVTTFDFEFVLIDDKDTVK